MRAGPRGPRKKKEEFAVTSKAAVISQTNQRPMAAFWALVVGLAIAFAHILAAPARAVPETFADLATQVSPSVVNITTSTTVATSTGPNPVVPEGSPFEDFFRDFMDRGENGQRPRRSHVTLYSTTDDVDVSSISTSASSSTT